MHVRVLIELARHGVLRHCKHMRGAAEAEATWRQSGKGLRTMPGAAMSTVLTPKSENTGMYSGFFGSQNTCTKDDVINSSKQSRLAKCQVVTANWRGEVSLNISPRIRAISSSASRFKAQEESLRQSSGQLGYAAELLEEQRFSVSRLSAVQPCYLLL